MTTKPDPRTLLSTLIEASGLSISAWARDVLGRDVRTVRRWRSGETEIPESVGQWLARVESVTHAASRVRVTVGT
jgi:hypothetical protein